MTILPFESERALEYKSKDVSQQGTSNQSPAVSVQGLVPGREAEVGKI